MKIRQEGITQPLWSEWRCARHEI